MEPMLSPSSSEEKPEIRNDEVRPLHGKRGGFFFLLLVLFVGFVGGVFSPVIMQKLEEKGVAEKAGLATKLERERIRVVAEDNVVVDLVEKNSPGVVSIVITKDVPKVRSFYNNPFGGFPFFNPFSMPQDQGGTGESEKQQIGSGSGFLVTPDGLVVTNKHVVSDTGAEYTIIAGQDKKEYSAKVLARDPGNDIAILKIDGNNFPEVSLGDSDKIRVGETVIAIGNPLGEFANSVSKGIISGLQRNLDAYSNFGDSERLSGIIQTDAAINPGNSGGPLFNLSGEVIGVNVAMAQGAENIGFALPINQIKSIVEQVKTTGKISVPYLGVRHLHLNKEIQTRNNLPFDYGALILRGQNMTDFAVIPGSPADKAGLVENDIILEINGVKLNEDHPLADEITQYKVGDELTLKVWHKGETKDVKVKLEERE